MESFAFHVAFEDLNLSYLLLGVAGLCDASGAKRLL